MHAIRRSAEPLLRAVLADPGRLAAVTPGAWDLLLRQARAAALLAYLDDTILRHGLAAHVPPPARRHLDGARWMMEKFVRDVHTEVARIAAPLAGLGAPVVVLKGAGYVVADLPPARVRAFTDVDIMVPRAVVVLADARLRQAGWEADEIDRWDERFYRAWMHENPPLLDTQRGTVVDVHHTIVPLTARARLDARLLFDAARPGVTNPDVLTLAPADMVLHSAVHLFNEGEFGRALRDLVDLDLLLRHFAVAEPEFWTVLPARAAALDLGRPLYFALRYAARLLGTPVPEGARGAVAQFAPAWPWLFDALFERALRPPHPSCRDLGMRLALFVLYVRGHMIRLPLRLLIPHLLRKAWKRGTAEAAVKASIGGAIT